MGQAILQHETAEFDGAPMLVAGPWARRNPVTVNPSYFSPATFAALGDDGRRKLGQPVGQLTLSLTGSDARRGQPAAGLGEDPGRQAGAERPPAQPNATPQYGFDAVRTLVRMAEDPDPAGREIAAKAWPAFEGRAPADIPVEHDLSGQPVGGEQHPVALVAAAGAADAAGDASAKAELLNAAEALDRETPTYYGAAWVALGRVMLETDALDCPWETRPPPRARPLRTPPPTDGRPVASRAAADEVVEGGGTSGRCWRTEGGSALRWAHILAIRRHGRERRSAGQHLEEHAGEPVDIPASAGLAALDLFGGDVVDGAQHLSGGREPRERVRALGEAEVGDVDVIAGRHDRV